MDKKELKNTGNTSVSTFNFTPANFSEVAALATHVAQSGLLGVRTQSEAMVLMLLAQQEGKNLIQTCLDYNIIQGKPALTSQATLIRFQRSGGSIRYEERSDQVVRIKFSHPASGELTVEWTIAKAQQIKSYNKFKQKEVALTEKENWINYPAAMLTARCIAEGVRALYPACLGGVYLVEEVQDFDDLPKQTVIDNQSQKIKLATKEDVVQINTAMEDEYEYEDDPMSPNEWDSPTYNDDDDPMSPNEWDSPTYNDDDEQQEFKL